MVDFIEENRKETNVFVHCFAGVSRLKKNNKNQLINYIKKIDFFFFLHTF
jgi:predicted protein tyrosine phosphatase